MSLARKVAAVVNEIGRCTWVQVNAKLPTCSEMMIRRALQNASAQGYVLCDPTQSHPKGMKGRAPAIYYPAPPPPPPPPPLLDAYTEDEPVALEPKAPRKRTPTPPNPHREERMVNEGGHIVAQALAKRHHLEGWMHA